MLSVALFISVIVTFSWPSPRIAAMAAEPATGA